MLIVAGRRIATKCESVTWEETGLTFGLSNAYKRGASRISIGAVHWTGGEGDAKGVHSVLMRRGLSVDTCIERDGRIVQYTDPAAFATWHAGSINRRAWGVEVINGAVKGLAAKDRPMQQMTIHGRDMMIADFYPAQIVALKELLEVFNGALGIPMRLPKDASGAVSATVVPSEKLATFTGVVGHYHVTKTKQDPGTQVWWDLNEAGVQWA